MLKKTAIFLFISLPLFSMSSEEYRLQQLQEFNLFKTQTNKEFKTYKEAQNKAFKDFKREIGAIWAKPIMSTKKSWVTYEKDKKTRAKIDFDKQLITLQTISTSKDKAEKQLKKVLTKVVTIDTKTLQETDPLEVRLSKLKKSYKIKDVKVKNEPILSTVVFEKKPTNKVLEKYINKNISKAKISAKTSPKIKNSVIYSVKVKLPKNSMIKRSKIYLAEIKKQAKRQDIPMDLIFAVMHTESSFNPRATSHIPAYGLMQIVPRTAGIDAYSYLYKQKKLVSSSYLYNSTNNITMGSAYLHILYYKYLKKIKDPISRLYCTIAAYNTGAGNIAWAFTRTYNMNKAAPFINAMTPKEVYAKLLKDLKFEEPKHYLQNVSARMSAYKKLYG